MNEVFDKFLRGREQAITASLDRGNMLSFLTQNIQDAHLNVMKPYYAAFGEVLSRVDKKAAGGLVTAFFGVQALIACGGTANHPPVPVDPKPAISGAPSQAVSPPDARVVPGFINPEADGPPPPNSIRYETYGPNGQKPIPPELASQITPQMLNSINRITLAEATDKQNQDNKVAFYFAETSESTYVMVKDQANRYTFSKITYVPTINLVSGQTFMQLKTDQGFPFILRELDMKLPRQSNESPDAFIKRVTQDPSIKAQMFQAKAINTIFIDTTGRKSAFVDSTGNAKQVDPLLALLGTSIAHAAEADNPDSKPTVVPTIQAASSPTVPSGPSPEPPKTAAPATQPSPTSQSEQPAPATAVAPAAVTSSTAEPTRDVPPPTVTPVATVIVPNVIKDPTKEPQTRNEVLPGIIAPEKALVDAVVAPYAKAFGVEAADVQAQLSYKEIKDKQGNTFAVATASDGTPLLIAEKSQSGEYVWRLIELGEYWHSSEKFLGVYLNGDEARPTLNKDIVLSNFGKGGYLSLNGQVRPGPDIDERKPSSALTMMQLAARGKMGVNFHFITEPGKYPKTVNKDNVGVWMTDRLSATADLVKANTTGEPTIIEYNEAWSTKRAAWNEEKDPLKDKYGEKWAEEFIYQTLTVFINKGLVPNKDFLIMFNENRMYNNAEKQNLVHETLLKARVNAFNRLVANQMAVSLLNKNGIFAAEDIPVLLGAETHTKIGEQVDDGAFIPDPTTDQIKSLASLFGDLGGIVMSEVNPQGDAAQKKAFLNKVTSLLRSVEQLRGVILWNIFEDPGDSTDKSGLNESRTGLFNPDGSPTQLYYALLQ